LAASLRHNAEAQRTRIARARERVETLMQRAARAVAGLIDRRLDRLDRAGQLLGALSYHGVLARGFALVRGPENQPLRTAAAVATGMRLDIEFQDGHVGAVASTGATGQREPIAALRPRPRRRGFGGEGQGSLF
jgi:exodeoxyribonuclease VII large subunit